MAVLKNLKDTCLRQARGESVMTALLHLRVSEGFCIWLWRPRRCVFAPRGAFFVLAVGLAAASPWTRERDDNDLDRIQLDEKSVLWADA